MRNILHKIFAFGLNREPQDYVAGIEPWIGDGLMLTLHDGKQVEVSRRQARELKLRLEL
jgi:DNA-binding LytR/AlgR family response regulator